MNEDALVLYSLQQPVDAGAKATGSKGRSRACSDGSHLSDVGREPQERPNPWLEYPYEKYEPKA